MNANNCGADLCWVFNSNSANLSSVTVLLTSIWVKADDPLKWNAGDTSVENIFNQWLKFVGSETVQDPLPHHSQQPHVLVES